MFDNHHRDEIIDFGVPNGHFSFRSQSINLKAWGKLLWKDVCSDIDSDNAVEPDSGAIRGNASAPPHPISATQPLPADP